MDDREVLVGTRERDFDSLLPGKDIVINNTIGIVDTNSTLESQPCFVCSFRWVLNGGSAEIESSFKDGEKSKSAGNDIGSQMEEKVVRSKVGSVGSGSEGGDEDSAKESGEEGNQGGVNEQLVMLA